MSPRLKIILIEPFWGGSHRAAAEGWARHSRHQVEIESLPPRFWKWRMRGAAFELARRLRQTGGGCDVLFATDLLDLAHLRALLPRRVPAILYFHENQLSYPPRPGEEGQERDLQYAFTNLASALSADRVAFNSRFQRDAFFPALSRLLRRMPDARPLWALEEIEAKTVVLPLGVELSDIPVRGPRNGPGVILWNHRWEYDKGPEEFFGVLCRLAGRGVPFRLIVAGESFGRIPAVFGRARKLLEANIVHWGCVPSRQQYVRLLSQADVVVSTALQENFGLSVVEAAYAGAHPLVPERLSYPEVIPPILHADCLYRTPEELESRLEGLLAGRRPPLAFTTLRDAFQGCRWEHRARIFDDLVCHVLDGAFL